jgi:hypothetical protein
MKGHGKLAGKSDASTLFWLRERLVSTVLLSFDQSSRCRDAIAANNAARGRAMPVATA